MHGRGRTDAEPLKASRTAGFSRRCGLRCPSSPAMSRRLCRRRRLPAQGDCHAGRVHAGGGYRQGHRLCVDHAGLLHCGRRQDRHGAEHLRPLVCRLHAPPSLRWWCCHFRYRRGEPERDPEPVPHGFGRRGAGGGRPRQNKPEAPFPFGEGSRGSILPRRGRGANGFIRTQVEPETQGAGVTETFRSREQPSPTPKALHPQGKLRNPERSLRCFLQKSPVKPAKTLPDPLDKAGEVWYNPKALREGTASPPMRRAIKLFQKSFAKPLDKWKRT